MLRACVVAAAIVVPAIAHAQDAFEIQVYDAQTAARGEPGLELHLNQHVNEGAVNETHLTFEPHYGLAAWAELGGYFQTAVTTTGDLAYAGVKLRLKLRRPQRAWDDRIGLAINGEISAVPSRFEPQVWGGEIRPIIDLTAGRLYASFNPILAVELRGDVAGHPQLEPAAKITMKLTEAMAIGAEAYGAFGPLDDLGSEHASRLLGVLDVSGDWWDLNIGGGYGWGSTDHVVAKLIVGIHPGA
ncbi:MAG: hypothetical protein E6J90_12475 [Deltaproteobacteria bacterium]|nr:MAG: hypothetical protein E6J90_12475 [Deltaproteobacteria bacterium]